MRRMRLQMQRGRRVVPQEQNAEEAAKLVYACAICKNIFKEPGYCSNCDAVLKSKPAG